MRAATLAIVVAACGLGQHRWHATPEQLAPMGPLDPRAKSPIGPLALEPGAATTSWKDAGEARQITEDFYLDKKRIHDETTAFLAVIDAFYQPLTPETKIGFEQAHQSLGSLERLDPYSVYNVTEAYGSSTQRLHLCIRMAGVTGPCDRDRKPRVTGRPVFEIGEAAPGIAKLVVTDLGNADDPAWRDFPAATRKLAEARGLVIDLREATGSDPRALLPWLAELTGRPKLAPLRAIERPASADAYVKAYADRYTDRGRDAAVWRTLLGPDTGAHGASTKQPIEILVGRHCESACELAARVLEAYAGAVVVGGVLGSGRLARDEPAMLVLPHSQATVYFHATRYLLAADIEAATGPTEAWRASDGIEDLTAAQNPYNSLDYMTWAIRDVAKRLEGGWPRCDALPAATADTDKVHGVVWLAQQGSCTYQISIRSKVPNSAMRRFLATCSPPIATTTTVLPGLFFLGAPKPTVALLTQIGASELVDRIDIECQVPMSIDHVLE